jgi:hypothetical protein
MEASRLQRKLVTEFGGGRTARKDGVRGRENGKEGRSSEVVGGIYPILGKGVSTATYRRLVVSVTFRHRHADEP